MWNEPSKQDLQKIGIPKLYDDEETPLKDKLIYGHFFIGACDWFIAEWDGGDLFFGYANLGDDQCAEWGYISFSELKSLNINGFEIEYDAHWKIRPAKEVSKIIFR
ncbi:hypothetical protein DSCW_01200 [Desulfosarcina widdelii]|uniref:DUF2958 domain-containing protein n=1 Tax=Desulfosarcina widdelii TaxID=947919 RepID=A0A5K7YXP2_9BACT|nr:DUF2958 domain-containing protein [Desulfosarcina widdelii]BBO72703.1 hypothetical protein DSCW_01200 [Desulfosarcina widdelii]